MRVLAIDHGEARCGSAICDPSGTLVRPLKSIPPDPARVAALVAELEAERVVVGDPVTLAGERGPQSRAAADFAEALAAELDVPVETYDERLTTRMADASAAAGAGADRDSLAAAHLLESYLQARPADTAGGATA